MNVVINNWTKKYLPLLTPLCTSRTLAAASATLSALSEPACHEQHGYDDDCPNKKLFHGVLLDVVSLPVFPGFQ
jgi:hypothetical protein